MGAFRRIGKSNGGVRFRLRFIERNLRRYLRHATEYSGLSHDALSDGGKIASSPDAEAVEPTFEINKPDFTAYAANGMYYAPGRVLHQPERDTTLSERNYLNVIDRVEIIEIHEDDAESLGVSQGDSLLIKDYDGATVAEGVATVTETMRGIVRSTTLFAELATYMEECEHPDPSPTVPGLDVRSVTVEVTAKGAGARIGSGLKLPLTIDVRGLDYVQRL